jgi:hypothetical protein
MLKYYYDMEKQPVMSSPAVTAGLSLPPDPLSPTKKQRLQKAQITKICSPAILEVFASF